MVQYISYIWCSLHKRFILIYKVMKNINATQWLDSQNAQKHSTYYYIHRPENSFNYNFQNLFHWQSYGHSFNFKIVRGGKHAYNVCSEVALHPYEQKNTFTQKYSTKPQDSFQQQKQCCPKQVNWTTCKGHNVCSE